MNTLHFLHTLTISLAIALVGCGGGAEHTFPQNVDSSSRGGSAAMQQPSKADCLESACAEQLNRCEEGCWRLIDCLASCSSASCERACIAPTWIRHVNEAQDVLSCASNYCY